MGNSIRATANRKVMFFFWGPPKWWGWSPSSLPAASTERASKGKFNVQRNNNISLQFGAATPSAPLERRRFHGTKSRAAGLWRVGGSGEEPSPSIALCSIRPPRRVEMILRFPIQPSDSSGWLWHLMRRRRRVNGSSSIASPTAVVAVGKFFLFRRRNLK